MVRCVDREPVVVLSCVLGGLGLGMPLVVPPIRRAIGLDTHQVSMPTADGGHLVVGRAPPSGGSCPPDFPCSRPAFAPHLVDLRAPPCLPSGYA